MEILQESNENYHANQYAWRNGHVAFLNVGSTRYKIVDGKLDYSDYLSPSYQYDEQGNRIGEGLTLLDTKAFPKLKILDCDNHQLTTLDVGKNTALEELYYDEDKVTVIGWNK